MLGLVCELIIIMTAIAIGFFYVKTAVEIVEGILRGTKAAWFLIPVGTRSLLFGAHCFFLHPWFVAWGWWKLFGFPLDPRLWVAFIIHDWGYWGKPNMDGPEGETHPILGGRIMSFLFDGYRDMNDWGLVDYTPGNFKLRRFGRWGQFSLFHSRYYSKSAGRNPSQLCFADKLAFALTPAWLYLPMTALTGELTEYLENGQRAENPRWTPTNFDRKKWHSQLRQYLTEWVETHKNGGEDTWIAVNRHEKRESTPEQSLNT